MTFPTTFAQASGKSVNRFYLGLAVKTLLRNGVLFFHNGAT